MNCRLLLSSSWVGLLILLPFCPTLPAQAQDANSPQDTVTDRGTLGEAYCHSSIIKFNAPGAGRSPGQGTYPSDVNSAGEITGSYVDTKNVNHGFLRARDGTFTTFDARGAGTGSGQGTEPQSNNPADAITGYYIDASGVYHGFLRAPDGTFATFDAPGAGTGSGQGTEPALTDGLNPEGAIAGSYYDADNVGHGFVRAPDGDITTFDISGAGSGPNQGTSNYGINPAGTTMGPYIDSSGVNHGYVRSQHGDIITFDVAGAGTGSGQGTTPFNNNSADAITGFYVDANNVAHGFLRTP
jgi:hypothetical protein